MIKFKSIEAEGFGSFIQPFKFELDRGNTVITIKGRVGAGKTTLPSILSWGCFGKLLKEKASVETWEAIRPENWRGTKVVVNFTKGDNEYKIIRCKSFKGKIRINEESKVNGGNNILLFINGEYYNESKGKGNIQQTIEEILGYSFRLFKSTLVYGQNMKRIIEESGPDKKKIFDEAFENGFIDEAKNNEEVNLSKLKALREDTNKAITNELNRIYEYEDLLDEAKKYEKDFQKNKEKEIKEVKELIEENKKDLKYYSKPFKKSKEDKSLPIVLESIKKKHKTLDKNFKERSSLVDKIQDAEDAIEEEQKVLAKKPKLCPTCNLALSDKGYSNMKEKAEAEITKLNKVIRDWKKELKSVPMVNPDDIIQCEKEIERITDKIKEVETLKKQAKRNEETIDRLTKRNKQYKKKIEEIQSRQLEIKSNKYINKIKKAKDLKSDLTKVLAQADKNIAIKEWLIKDPLSNNGLKAYIFDNLLGEVNSKLEEYSKVLGFQVEFGIDLESRRKDFYQLVKFSDGLIVNYDDLSGGQRQLVNYAVAFATYDVITEIRPCNILFMDEPFESLNKIDIETITELINTKSKDRSVYIITHNESFSPMKAEKLIFSRDDNGNTVIE